MAHTVGFTIVVTCVPLHNAYMDPISTRFTACSSRSHSAALSPARPLLSWTSRSSSTSASSRDTRTRTASTIPVRGLPLGASRNTGRYQPLSFAHLCSATWLFRAVVFAL